MSASRAPADRTPAGRFVVHLVDVSEQKRRICELTPSNGELSSFAFLAAHELKAPLQSMSGFAALLDRTHGAQLDPQAREFVRWIADGAARMDALIEDLLAYCSVDTAEAVLGRVALDDVLADALGQLDGEVAARGATVGADGLPVVTGDPVQLGQLLQNLLANALKFMPEGRAPRIHVSAERDGDGWTVTVADNGIGVEPGARGRIFTMFQPPAPPRAVRGHRDRPVDLQAHRRAPGRHDLGRARRGGREPLPLPPARCGVPGRPGAGGLSPIVGGLGGSGVRRQGER